ncbi:NB-ARC domain-containing protein [Streptomyces sp. NPDC091280]|uniref:NB-ARC domain-containing protein n=1 Tax=Streptomyces sp. NPDC091280 TaxID=3365984 RepID=UPI003801E77F
MEFHGDADVALIGDYATVHVHPKSEPVPAPFLAPPRPSGLLVGREDLRAQIRQGLAGGAVALYGLPGVGKTALALDLAYDREIRERFPDGVLWAGLGSRAEGADVLQHLVLWGEQVGLTPEHVRTPGVLGWSESLHRRIGSGRFLLVIDDAWDPDGALALQVGGPDSAQLLTTRFPSVALEFGGMALRVDELTPAGGLQLLQALAEEAVDAYRAVAVDLVELVGGLPLALTLIGHHLRGATVIGHDSVTEALERLRQAEERLRLQRRQAPAAAHPSISGGLPISLLAALDIGYDRLPEETQRALLGLAAFLPKPNDFPLTAALAVTETAPEVLRTAVWAGLVESPGRDRYTMHQVVHDYVRSKGAGTGHGRGDLAAAERRMAAVYVGIVGGRSPDGVRGGGVGDASVAQEAVMTSEEFQSELGNVLHALDHAHRHAMHEELLAGVDAAYPLLVHRGLYILAEPHLQNALHAARAVGDARAEARTLLRLGSVVLERGDLREGGRYLDEGMHRAQETDSIGEIIGLLLKLGWSVGMRGDLESARRYFSDALVGAQGVEAVPALQGLGWVDGLQGRHDESAAHLQRGLELAREAGVASQIAGLLQVSGWMRTMVGAYAESQDLFAECLALARAERLGTDEVDALHGLGWLAIHRGHYASARELLTEGLRLARDLDYHEYLPLMINLGRVLTSTGSLDEAGLLLREAVAMAQTQDRPEKLSDALSALARQELAAGRPEAAEHHLHESLSVAERIAVRSVLVEALQTQAELELAHGHTASAQDPLLRAMRLERGNAAMLARLRLQLAESHAAQEDHSTAKEIFRAAFAGAERTGQEELAALCLYGQARGLAAAGDADGARSLGSEAVRRLDAMDSPNAPKARAWVVGL